MNHRCRRWSLAILVVVSVAWQTMSLATAQETAGTRKRQMDPQRFSASYGYPGTGVDPLPLPGPRPYWGQALGATYYNWGYFGAHSHAQYITHRGYYNDYAQFGYTKGY
jgi:hypothetical protein